MQTQPPFLIFSVLVVGVNVKKKLVSGIHSRDLTTTSAKLADLENRVAMTC
jgi:hypothetical protein